MADTQTAAARPGHPMVYQVIDEIAQLHARKNADYSGGKADSPLGNFHRVSTYMRQFPGMAWDTPLGVAIVYALKQLDAALILLSTGRDSQTGESPDKRFRDVSVYMIIAEVLYREAMKTRGGVEADQASTDRTRRTLRQAEELDRLTGNVPNGLVDAAAEAYRRFNRPLSDLTAAEYDEIIAWARERYGRAAA